MAPALRVAMVFLLVCRPALAQDATTLQYRWLTAGKPSGAQTTTVTAQGTSIDFEFNDRGRGPKTQTSIVLNANGVPTRVVVSGNNYRKATVNERFDVQNNRARWRSSIEEGQAGFDGSAFFLPFNAPPEVMAMLARAALASDDNAVDVLPSGRASIRALHEQALSNDMRITLYQIDGIDTRPGFVWLDQDAHLFGVDYGPFGVVRKGYESHINILKQYQEEAETAYFSDVARRHTRQLEGLLVIRGARLFDSVAGTLTPPATVTIFEGKISAIYFSEVAVPDEALVIDAQGQTLMPTLWDMHGHVDANQFLNYLAAGVTNVRDMANDHDYTLRLQNQVHSRVLAGPDLHKLGFIDKRGEFSAPSSRLADSLADAQQLVDFYAQHGYVGIKLYSSIEPKWVAPLARAAHARGLSVQGHVPAFMDADEAIDAGFDELTHINMVLLNFLGGGELDTRTPTRFTVPGERAATIDLASPEVTAFVRKMRERDVALDPTLSIFMNTFLNEPGKVSHMFRTIADHLPASVRRRATAAASFNDGNEVAYAAAAARSLELTRLLHERGIRLLPGTDHMLPGFTLIRELRYYAEAGIPHHEVLRLATFGAAQHLGQEASLGSIAVGKRAHVYLVDGNPVEDLAALYRVREVVKGRQLYFAPDILTEQGFTPF